MTTCSSTGLYAVTSRNQQQCIGQPPLVHDLGCSWDNGALACVGPQEVCYHTTIKCRGVRIGPSQLRHKADQNTTNTTPLVQVNMSIVAQAMAAVVATLRAGGHSVSSEGGHHRHKMGEELKPYITFQPTKLKGFSCVWNNASLQPIWDYFKSTMVLMHSALRYSIR